MLSLSMVAAIIGIMGYNTEEGKTKSGFLRPTKAWEEHKGTQPGICLRKCELGQSDEHTRATSLFCWIHLYGKSMFPILQDFH
jgi:hypothetical protein